MTSSASAVPTGEPAPFSVVLREATKLVHREAERAGFVADLLRGRASSRGYALFLRNLHPAYAALEPALAWHEDTPILGAFADTRLARLTALEADLASLAGPDWEDEMPATPAARSYAEAIAAAADEPARLVAHAYARYLGDLSGGQILKPLLARSLGLLPESLSFYDFPLVADPAEPKAAMRDALDQIPPDGGAAAALVEEAVLAFRHNIAVSEAVQGALQAAS